MKEPMWIYTCYCGHRWKERRSVVSFLSAALLGDFAMKSKVLRPTMCPKCGRSPKCGITEDGKQGCAHI
ncbi:hypothetical protein M0R04_15720 [Candidatus Dojkabacteria bacterium]|jgi:hypothetical protein|nr:hypothetical protein [Candidatus Dojkabacteria bacterium]